ncbi:MAG: polysaccharide export outer membrane protein [Limisphaerales bacterium]|jgi:polysaccharide export outer membrane protein
MRQIYFLVFIAICLSSCKVWNPNAMFRTNGNFEYIELDDLEPTEYKIQAGDKLDLIILTNEGYSLLNPGISQGQSSSGQQSINYEVDIFGVAKLPRVDTVHLEGMSIRDAENFLEEAYTKYFKEPFVKLEVTNRRVFVFRGSVEAEVVPLVNENVTLIEVLAQSGGVPQTGKAFKIKLVRGDLNNPEISLINLRHAEDLGKVNMIVQPDDVIYIDPILTPTLLLELAPVIGFVSSAIALYAVLKSAQN